jgi:hypothetical protein
MNDIVVVPQVVIDDMSKHHAKECVEDNVSAIEERLQRKRHE